MESRSRLAVGRPLALIGLAGGVTRWAAAFRMLKGDSVGTKAVALSASSNAASAAPPTDLILQTDPLL